MLAGPFESVELQMAKGKVLFSDGTIWNWSSDWLYISNTKAGYIPNMIYVKAANWGASQPRFKSKSKTKWQTRFPQALLIVPYIPN